MMNNEMLEKVLQFLNQLKGENRSRKSTVQITGLKEQERETEQLWQEFYFYIEKLPMRNCYVCKVIIVGWKDIAMIF